MAWGDPSDGGVDANLAWIINYGQLEAMRSVERDLDKVRSKIRMNAKVKPAVAADFERLHDRERLNDWHLKRVA